MNESKVIHSVFNSKESDVENSPVNDRFKKGEGFHAVPPLYTGNYMPSRPDLSFAGLDDYVYKTKDTDSDNDSVFRPKTDQTKPKFTKINFVKSDENVKFVNKENTHKQVEYHRKSQSPRGNRRNWNGMMTQKLGNGFEFIKKACLVCGSFNHLIKDCDFHDNKMVENPMLNNKGRVTGQREIRPVWNNVQRVNHQNKLTHSHPKRNFVSIAVATKLGQVPVNAVKQNSPRVTASISTVRPVNTAAPKSKVNDALPKTYSYFKAHSPLVLLWDMGKMLLSSQHARFRDQQEMLLTIPPKKVDHTYYQEVDGGFVAFVGSPKGRKITRKGKIRTGKLDFEDVYFVKELKFNLFYVSQMCDNKNSVLFTETARLVLSPDFKLLDESQVLLKVPKHNNMYNFDLKNVVHSGGLTCLFVKATIDESNLWHRRLGHINFKTMNKLVKGNLVRGLPSKLFENDHTCVAFQKGNQHKASCKTKLVSSISQPLQMLHMDLFRPTSVRSINHKIYCLVVTDDYSRFSWVFFLATKDETSGILKTFITGIENQINHKGLIESLVLPKLHNKNGVAERKNRTLIEAARTMLADSLLPTTFWAEAVSTACYVQNRVLVTKPHNKTPYELLHGRPPSISFMRPFGCPVTILNTLDPLVKFDGKADEGFFVGYSINSKAFRVFNPRTKNVEENLHITFLENKPNVAGSGLDWLFDIDLLTNSMNYEPVTAGNQTNKNAGIKDNVDAVPTQQYILLPVLYDSPQSSKDAVADDAGKKTNEELANKDERNGTDISKNHKKTVKNGQARTRESEEYKKKPRIQNRSQKSQTRSQIQSKCTAGQSFTKADDLPTDSLMPDLEVTTELLNTGIFSGAYDDEDVGAEADLNNLETTMNVSPIPTTRIHKNHPKDQIIGDINLATQTRRMTKISKELAMVTRALTNPRWIEAMQYKLLQFRLQKDRSNRVIFGLCIIYGVYCVQDGCEECLLYGIIEEEVYVCQPPGFEDPQFPDKVYKVEKALYVLHQAPKAWYETLSTYLLENGFKRGIIDKTLFIKKNQGDILLVQVMQRDDGIFISQDKYVDDILKKFDFVTIKTTSTPIETNKALLKDEEAEEVDVYLYRSMIRSLMYLTASRPDIMFAVCAYARDSPFDLEAFSDSDYAGASLDRKSTTGGCQFLGKMLISWQCKKQTVVANSTTKAEYVAVANCCRQVLWIQNQMLDYGFNFMNTKIYIDNESTICIMKNPVFHSKTKHIEIRHHFIKDSYEKKLIQVIKILTDHNVADLLTKAFDVNRKAKSTTEISQFSGPIPLVTDETVIKEWEDRMEMTATTASSLEAEQDSDKINRTQSLATLNESFPQGVDLGSGPRCQDTISRGGEAQTRFEAATKQSNDPPLSRVNTLGSGEDNMKLKLNLLLPVLVYAARLTLTAVGIKKPKESNGFEEIIDFLITSSVQYALMVNPTIYTTCIEQFWTSAKVKTVNREHQI
ncbi:putative ribonuclease H-like domain-containing protein [Tanacetum coccineum]|uniref:Ribonuclease H-like domain-containing protein n=1 Tax=Tanacetum coccineum TaxID=301880 RepID=A0ABQ4XWC1_9ASTR